MSSRSAALLARAAMFALEALEPRWLLSGDVAGEIIPIDIEAGVGLRHLFDHSSVVQMSFEAREGTSYLFTMPDYLPPRLTLIAQGDPTPLVRANVDSDSDDQRRLVWVAPKTG